MPGIQIGVGIGGSTPPRSAPAASLPQAASLVAAWSADDISPQADNTAIAGWTDGKNGAVANQFGSVPMPKYRTNVVGTHPAVQFDGTMALKVARTAGGGAWASAIDSQEYTIIAVFTGLAATQYGVLYSTTSSFSDGIFQMANGSQIGPYLDNQGAASFIRHMMPLSDAGFHTFGYSSTKSAMNTGNTGVGRTYIDGACMGPGQDYPLKLPTSGSGNLFGIGACVNGSAGGYDSNRWAGKYLRLYIWNRCLTPAEMVLAEKYIRDAYGQAYPWTANTPHIFVGDSITQGYSISDLQYQYPAKVAATLSLPYGSWWNLGLGGISMDGIAANAETQALATALGRSAKVALFEWYNQRYLQSLTGAQAAARTQAYVQTLSGALPSGSKILLGTSTDSANDDTDSNTQRGAYNSALVSGGVSWGANGVLSIHTNANIGVAGTNSNTTYFSDGVHLQGIAGASGTTTLASLTATALAAL